MRIGDGCSINSIAYIHDTHDNQPAEAGLITRIGSGAEIGDQAAIGNNAAIGERSRVGTGSQLGDGIVVRPRAVIGADCKIEPAMWGRRGAWIGAGAVIGDLCQIKKNTQIDAHAVLENGSRIGERQKVPSSARSSATPETPSATGAEHRQADGQGAQPQQPAAAGKHAESARIDPTAIVHPNTQVGADAQIGPGAEVHEDAVIGKNAVVEVGAVIGPRTIIGDDAWVDPGAKLGSDCQIIAKDHIGAGALLGDGCKITGTAKVRDGAEVPAGTTLALEPREIPEPDPVAQRAAAKELSAILKASPAPWREQSSKPEPEADKPGTTRQPPTRGADALGGGTPPAYTPQTADRR